MTKDVGIPLVQHVPEPGRNSIAASHHRIQQMPLESCRAREGQRFPNRLEFMHEVDQYLHPRSQIEYALDLALGFQRRSYSFVLLETFQYSFVFQSESNLAITCPDIHN